MSEVRILLINFCIHLNKFKRADVFVNIIYKCKYISLSLRRKDSRGVRKLYKGSPGGVQPRKRPRSRWRDSALSDIRSGSLRRTSPFLRSDMDERLWPNRRRTTTFVCCANVELEDVS